MIPAKIGRYQILGELGRGAMGQVYRAFDPNIGRHVAIKIIPLDPGNPELALRFRREAQAAGILSHPNIVIIYDAGADEGFLYIAMELVQGETLQQMLSRGPLPVDQVLSIGEQVGAALDHAHSHEIIHRDIKPANIMMQQGQVKVTDFGVAKMSAVGITSTGQVLGTPSYLAPEVVKGGAADARSDMFSLGVVLYEMLTGSGPFAGDSVATVIYKIIAEHPQPPGVVVPSLPPGLNYVILKALAKEPTERYQSCVELTADLKNYPALEEKGKAVAQSGSIAVASAARPPGGTVRLDLAELKPKPEAAKSPTPALPPVSRRKSAWAAAVVAMVVVVGGIVWQTRQAGETSSPLPPEQVVSPAPASPSPGSPAVNPERKSAQPADAPAPAGQTASTPPARPGPSPPASSATARTTPSTGAATPPPSSPTPSPQASPPASQLPGAMGRVVIHTQPAGAKILVNGQATPYRTPVNFALAPGRYEITVERSGFSSETQEVVVRENQIVQVRMDLERTGGILRRLPFRR